MLLVKRSAKNKSIRVSGSAFILPIAQASSSCFCLTCKIWRTVFVRTLCPLICTRNRRNETKMFPNVERHCDNTSDRVNMEFCGMMSNENLLLQRTVKKSLGSTRTRESVGSLCRTLLSANATMFSLRSAPVSTSTRAASTKYGSGLVTEGLPELDEDELEEKAVLGSGPGGQAVNKTHNACQLKHIPTGIRVKSHYTRSFELNRQRARLILRQKLDRHYHGENGVMARADREAAAKRDRKRKRSKERQEKLRAFKEREGID